jgi:hypothetical protein
MTSRPDRACVAKVFLLGLASLFVPEVLARPVHCAIRDALVPARSWLTAQVRHWMEPTVPATSVASVTQINQEQIRGLELEVARLRSERSDAATSENHTPLLVPIGVPARLLGDFATNYWRTNGALALGSASGVKESAVIIDSTQPLLDAGQRAGIAPSDVVRSGAVVVGMVGDVGVWSSLFRPITDREFRAGARLARRTPDGLVFAAEGVLQGDGDNGCELRMITPTEPVRVGDLVVTVARDTGLDEPLVFGEVEAADLPDNALEWSVKVKPARDWRTVSRVTVIRLGVHPEHMLAN